LKIGYNDKYIGKSVSTKFVTYQIDSHLTWKNHIDQLVPILSGTGYTVRYVLHIRDIGTQISLFCLFSFYNDQQKDIFITKENC
jgi:hypothetical protein